MDDLTEIVGHKGWRVSRRSCQMLSLPQTATVLPFSTSLGRIACFYSFLAMSGTCIFHNGTRKSFILITSATSGIRNIRNKCQHEGKPGHSLCSSGLGEACFRPNIAMKTGPGIRSVGSSARPGHVHHGGSGLQCWLSNLPLWHF
ncbi:hypothetical protein CDAR_4161 [Caerostris darwini]|uniref:Uncharacterized protein n=1 Tax=Caerostris darwini TaxID=1538125 RepID=A0AAV4N489_9ARAC|nr:hypothetical protein CDAR_4161 [Caerostris darwini]